jgi:hypothetical protein
MRTRARLGDTADNNRWSIVAVLAGLFNEKAEVETPETTLTHSFYNKPKPAFAI